MGHVLRALSLPALALLLAASPTSGQCPEQPALLHFTGAGTIVCPCFVSGEEAGAVFTAPAGDYPIEVLRVGVGWGSQFGGAPQSLEDSIRLYAAGLPNPGAPIFTLGGPVLNDGFLNEFDLEPFPGNKIINSGPFTVTLKFLNQNAGDPFAPSTVHDGNGCQSGKNVVFAVPGGWANACLLGVTGDWVFYAIYREVNCGVGVGEELVAASTPAFLSAPQPNPFRGDTRIEFLLDRERNVELTVHDVAGRMVAHLADRAFPAGRSTVTWDGKRDDGTAEAAGIYFVTMRAGDHRQTRKVTLAR